MSVFEQLLEVLKSVYEDEIDITKVKPEDRLKEDLNMQSMGMLYMAVAIEEQMGVKLQNSDFPVLNTVQDVVDLVASRIEQ